MAATQALKFLETQGVVVSLHPYDYDPAADAVGMQAAAALGIAPAQMLKTLMLELDGKPVCCVIPADCQLSMKRVAAAFGGKAAAMMLPARAEKLTGYRVGGISPFGQKRAVPTAFEVAACGHARVWINAGQRGLLLGIDPQEALRVTAARAAPLVA